MTKPTVHTNVAGPSWLPSFKSGMYNIMRSWSLGDDRFPDWRLLQDEQKWDWLLACCSWDRIQTSYTPTAPPIIDGGEIHSMADFYCLLGERFFGHRGYLGSNLDALHDCITSFIVNDDNRILYFKHFDEIKLVLDTSENLERYEQPYTEIVLEILQQRGFEVRMIA